MSPFSTSFTICSWMKRLHDASHPIVLHYWPWELVIGDNGYWNYANGYLDLSGRFPEAKQWFHHCLSWVVGETKLQKTQTALEESETKHQGTKSVLTESETQHQGTKTELSELESELQEAWTALEESETKHQETKSVLTESETQHQGTKTELSESETELQQKENKLIKTEQELQEITKTLNDTLSELTEMKENKADCRELKMKLQETDAKLNSTQQELQENTKTQNGNLLEEARSLETVSRWDVLFTPPYLNKLFTRQLYNQLTNCSWDMMEEFIGVNVTVGLVEHFRQNHAEHETCDEE
ncbi:epidermal growth factor receptor substrate 15 homolog [Bolinopsis microptera]|uniref:epidermal growth factor receptor substrate 15 homolog n=1 Tax=Bolinopsis microptera TaxID=2820187 RepID=UPI0030792613